MTAPRGWADAKLSDVTPADAPIIYGILQPGPNLAEGVPYVRPTEIDRGVIDVSNVRRTSQEIARQYSRSTLQSGDLILSIVGTIGKVAEAPILLDGGNITQSSCRIRPQAELIERGFLKSFLLAPIAIAQYDRKRLGTAVPRLNIADIRDFDLPLPPLSEQRRIVAKLDALTARLVRARAELDRVTALAPRLRTNALRDALHGVNSPGSGDWSAADLQRISLRRALYLKKRRGSRLANFSSEISKFTGARAGWLDCRLADVVDLRVGFAFKSANFEDAGTALVRGANIAPGRIDWSERVHVSARHAEQFKDFRLSAGDIVLAMDRPVISTGLKLARIDISDEGTLLVQRVANPMPTPDIEPDYLYLVLRSEFFLQQIDSHATGSDLPHISGNDVLATPCPLPPIPTQRLIVASVEAAFARADRLEAEAARARKLIDRLEAAILAKAFRGELVPQDPNDESASVLLERIRAQRAAAPKPKRGRRTKAG